MRPSYLAQWPNEDTISITRNRVAYLLRAARSRGNIMPIERVGAGVYGIGNLKIWRL